jgi:hypothetical protein
MATSSADVGSASICLLSKFNPRVFMTIAVRRTKGDKFRPINNIEGS